MIQNLLTVFLLLSAYGVVVGVLIWISVKIVNSLYIDPIEVKSTQHITVEPKHYRKVA